jgi:hypothetical protein
MTEPAIQIRPAQHYLGFRGRITEGVPAFVDRAFPELFGWHREHGVEPAGPPFLRYDEVDREGVPVELEVGVPVSGDPDGDDRVRPQTLPAERYLDLSPRRPYRSETLPDLAAAREHRAGSRSRTPRSGRRSSRT